MVEVRRAEGGIRAWAAEPGEYFHALDGAYGGLWRRNGRPPQELCGVGFSAQGLFEGSYYRRMPGAEDPTAAWIFAGIDNEVIGDFGLSGGGAAGFELDRADVELGTPPNALILTRSEGHQQHFVAVPEELLTHVTTITGEKPKALIRAEIVYFETVSGGRPVFDRFDNILRQPVSQQLRQQYLPHAGERAAAVRATVISVLKPEERLRIVMQDLVGVGFRQSEPLDIGERLLVRLVILQDGVIAPGHQMIGAERFERADKRRL